MTYVCVREMDCACVKSGACVCVCVCVVLGMRVPCHYNAGEWGVTYYK